METILKLLPWALSPAFALGLSAQDSLHLNVIPLRFEDQGRVLQLGLSLQDSAWHWSGTLKETRHLVSADARMLYSMNAFDFDTRVRVSTEWTSSPIFLHPYEPILGMPYNPQVIDSTGGLSRRTWDYLTARSRYSNSWIQAGLAFDYIQTGPGVRQHLMWSGDQNILRPWHLGDSLVHQSMPMLYGYWDMPFKSLRYRQWSGSLRTLKQSDKFFHSQRLDVQWRGFLGGFTQSVAYGSLLPSVDVLESPYPTDVRTFQWLYALPFVPYYFTQHILGDRDNTLMSFDAQYQWGNFRIYSELLLDDLKSPLVLLKDDWWGNKFGALSGLEWKIPSSFGNWNLNLEHTHLEPWVYTHRYGRGLNWEHYGQSMGSDLGPNSRETWASLTWQHSRGFQIQAQGLYVEKGTDKGSRAADLHYSWDRTDKIFLDPQSSLNYTQWGLKLSDQPWGALSWSLGYDYSVGHYRGSQWSMVLRTSL